MRYNNDCFFQIEKRESNLTSRIKLKVYEMVINLAFFSSDQFQIIYLASYRFFVLQIIIKTRYLLTRFFFVNYHQMTKSVKPNDEHNTSNQI